MANVRKILRRLHEAMVVTANTRKKMSYERLRQKIAEDIHLLMKEKEISYEYLAYILRLRVAEMRRWVWERDLKLSELTKILNGLDSEMYPLIRPRKTGKENEE